MKNEWLKNLTLSGHIEVKGVQRGESGLPSDQLVSMANGMEWWGNGT